MYYEIREDWEVYYQHEYYFNIRQNLKEVKEFIEDWIDTWEDNAEDNGYRWLGFETDYKTYAMCRIETDNTIDTFKIEVTKKKGKQENVTGVSK
ncbi:MAG: hypothetical protein GWP09_01750 [Nitrospiraceae bacterium]|nr:hypothetical protein [Nitrospiraceae bacterium]